jgi:hypothetical protein
MIYNGSGYLGDPPGIQSYPTMTPPTVMVLHNNGGNLSEFVAYWRTVAIAPDVVKIFGPCASGCTMVMAYIPKERLCFGPRGALLFHQARRNAKDWWISSPETSKWMIDKYPANIRHWVMAKGGPEKMLSDSYWKLPAEELWEMGYRKCNDKVPDWLAMQQDSYLQRDRKNEQRYRELTTQLSPAERDVEKLWNLPVGESIRPEHLQDKSGSASK